MRLLVRAAMVLAGRISTAAISVHHLVIVSILTEATPLAFRHIMRHFTASLVLLLSHSISRLSLLFQFLLLPQQLLFQSLTFCKTAVQCLNHDRSSNFNPSSLGLLLSQVTLHESFYDCRIRIKVFGQF